MHSLIKYFLFLLLFFIAIKTSFSQNKKRDSLWGVYNNKTQSDTNRLSAIRYIAWNYRGNKPDTAIILAQQELKLAQESKQKKLNPNLFRLYESNAFIIIGISYSNKGDYPKALEYCLKSLTVTEEIKDKRGVGACCSTIGSIYSNQSNYPKALEYYLKALRLNEEIGDKDRVGTCYSKIGSVYFNQSNFSKALDYFLKYLQIKEKTNDKQGIGAAYNNIGSAYQKQKSNAIALEYFLKAIKIFEEIDDKPFMGNCYMNIAEIYNEQSKSQNALTYHLKSLKIYKETGGKQGIGISYNNLSSLNIKLANYKVAIQYSDSALQISKEIGDIDIERLSNNNLSVAYSGVGNYKGAYESHVKFKALTDSIFNEENSKQLGDMKTQFEVEKKEAELKIKAEAQEAITAEEKKKQQIIIYAVAGVLALVVIFSLFLFNRFRVTQKQKKIIEEQKILVDRAYESLHEKNTEVMDSINYAKRIQTALITSEKYIENRLNRLIKK